MYPSQSQHEESYELNDSSPPNADYFTYSSSFDIDESRANLLTNVQDAFPRQYSLIDRLSRYLPVRLRPRRGSRKYVAHIEKCRTCLNTLSIRRFVVGLGVIISIVALTCAVFFPSYTNPPKRYTELRSRAEDGTGPGRANPERQKVYIAASIFDIGGGLAGGPWGEAVVSLIDLLGPENVYLSIYENDAGPEAEAALQNLGQKISCDHTVKFDKHLNLDEVPHVQLPDGSDRVKRIAYLSEVRNRALRPLQTSHTKYDKLIYLNDVVFDPVEAVQLLFNTNANDEGKAQYRAACALDFDNPFKYYDTFATRDHEGYGIGLPIFPFFTTAGHGLSRRDVMVGSDAVRVRSCWGGMVAFDARYFQQHPSLADVPATAGSEGPKNMTPPFEFRAEDDLYWDASECCLIHADIQSTDTSDSEIYINPYIRVAYDKRTLSWLGVSRRFERALSPVHYVLTKIVGMPWYNPRRSERAWDQVEEKVWVADPQTPAGGSFQVATRTASHSGFCGRPALQVLKKDITSKGKNWEFIPVPGS